MPVVDAPLLFAVRIPRKRLCWEGKLLVDSHSSPFLATLQLLLQDIFLHVCGFWREMSPPTDCPVPLAWYEGIFTVLST
jgi:hypothetical protein